MILATSGLTLTLSLVLLGPAPQQDAKKELQAIQKELEQEGRELKKAMKAAGDADADALYSEFREKILPEFAERYAAVGRANKGNADGLAAWSSVLDLVNRGLGGNLPGEALTALTRDHLQSEELAEVAANLRWNAQVLGEDKTTAALRKIAEGSPHRKVQAAALYTLGAVLGEERTVGDPRLTEARAVLSKLASYADVEERDGRSYAKAGAALIFAFENLIPGRPCPDFGAVDAEGVPFKLSDYKGKVVLIDFWGFW